MKVSYYPGCSLHGTAREYDESTKAICEILGVELKELDDWNCCGASSAHSSNHFLSIALPARNLAIAEKCDCEDLVVPCAACFQRLKTAEQEIRDNPHITDEVAYGGKLRISHLLDFLCTDEHLKRVQEKIKKPLSGLKTVSYYGCLTMRPPRVTGAEDFENPQKMDKLLKVMGAENHFWSYKTDCCGGSLVLTRPDIVKKLCSKLFDMAIEAGADAIVSACPLCQGNLDTRQSEIAKEFGKDYYLPIFYFTELMGLAFDHPHVSQWFDRHFIDPKKLLQSVGLM
ncbi:MAG: CoB--CoM heterodisulfide reductase iron-sulfur subunit B family protein [Thermodesulfobacteriota bacterium]|nr:CoB--CoM heterodisulfide reductase iron-sulfur subunit B family protein [Thermodesulfobacteriota bacterium]